MPLSGESTEGRSTERANLRVDLDTLEGSINELRLKYEQYFTGLLPFAPEKEHANVKQAIKRLRKAPFKTSALNYRLKNLEFRFNTLNTYWQRVLKEREEGTYSKDIFKAQLREKIAQQEQYEKSGEGKVNRGMKSLFDTYRRALEDHTGKTPNLDFNAFKKSLVQRAKELKEKHGATKLSFKVVLKEGKVTIKASTK